MSEDNILSLIGKDAVEQFDNAIKMVDALGAKIKATNDMINDMPKPEKGGSSNADLKNLVDLQKQVVTMQKQISDLEAKLANAYKNTSTEVKNASNNAVEYYKIKDRQDKATVRLTRALKAQQRALDAENKALLKLQDPYEQMKATYRDSANYAKSLGAELWQLMQTEGASEEQIKKLAEEYRNANKSALELHVGLSDIERATGQSQRNVGNYNGLLVETNHILREIPNFAMSARTGILSLSNNIPMFADQFRKMMGELDDDGKVKGLSGAFKELGKAVFSWHTLLIVGITLAIQYADEIGNFFTALSRGELSATSTTKAMRSYNEAIKESVKNTSSQIAELERLRVILNDSEQSYSNQADALSNAKQSNSEYLGTLTMQNIKLDEANKLIDQQIDLIRKKASEEARVKAIAAQAEKVAERELKYLESTQSFWSKLWGGEKYNLRKLTEEKEVLVTLTGLDLEANTKNLEILEKQHSEAIKKAKAFEDILSNLKQISAFDAKRLGDMYKQVDAIQELIDKQKELIEGSKVESIIPISDEDDTLRALRQAAVYRAKSDKERIESQKDLNKTLMNIELNNLREQWGFDEIQLAGHKQYQALKNEIIAKYERMNQDLYKGGRKARKASLDREIKGLLEYSKVMNALSSSMGEANLYHLDKIASDEENALSKRLDAIEQGAENRRRIINASLSDEINANEERIKLAEEALKKIESLRTDEEQSAIIDLDLMYTERERLTINYNTEMEKLTDETEKKKLDTIKQYQDMLIREARETADELFRQSKISLNKQLIELNKTYMNGNMSYRGYMRERRKITYEHGEEERKQVVDMYNKMMADSLMKLAMHGLTSDEKEAIRKKMEEVNRWMEEQMAGLAPRKERSWMDMIFGDKVSDDPNDADAMEARKQATIDAVKGFYEDIFNAIDAIRERRYRDQLDVLDKESERIKENAQIEKDAVESSLLSQEEKAKRMEEIATRQEAFQAGIDEKRRRIENEKARADKRAALFRIALDGAMAVSKAFATLPFPASAIVAAIVGASVAAQLVAASAQSVPVYGDGTDNHVGGLAVVGDRGTELVKTPQGKSFLTPNRSTLMDLPKGTKVIPNHELDLAHHKAMGHDIVHKYEMGDSNGMEALYMMFGDKVDELAEAIVNKKETHFHWDNGELRKSIKKGNNWTRYVNKII